MDNITELEKRIFREDKGKIYIGGEQIKAGALDLLKEQARYIKTSQFYEVLHATLINESYKLLIESKNWDNVQFGKSLKYLDTIIGNMLKGLYK